MSTCNTAEDSGSQGHILLLANNLKYHFFLRIVIVTLIVIV